MNSPTDKTKRGNCQSCEKRRADRLDGEVAMASLPFTTSPAFLAGQTKYNLQPAEGKPVGLPIADCQLPIANCQLPIGRASIFSLRNRSLFQSAIGNRQLAISPIPPRSGVPSRAKKNRPVVAMRRGDAERENAG
jgi:hypothetical protein